VVLTYQGPVDELTLNSGRIVVDGGYVIGRTSGIKFSIKRAARSYVSHLLSGAGCSRIYEGTGKILMCTTPYWRFRLKATELKDPILAE
jgi:uncharacterized protein (AIM24 family)